MSQRSGPVGGTRRGRRVKTEPAPRRARPADPAATWDATRAFCAGLDEVLGRTKSNPAASKSNPAPREAPEAPQRAYPDRDTRTGRTAAHDPTGGRDGHSTDDTDDPGCRHCGLAIPGRCPDCDLHDLAEAITAQFGPTTLEDTP